MELGSGLTLQTRTVGNKTTSGLYFMPQTNQKNLTKKKHGGEVKSVPTIPSRLGVQNKTQPTNKKVLREKVAVVTRNTSVKKSASNSRRNQLKSTEPHSPNGMKENIPKSKQQPRRPQSKKLNANSNNSNSKTIQQQQQVDPSYVTLTQDQLNTILSLVKTKHEIDVSKVIKDNDSGEVTVNDGTTSSKPGSGTSVRSKLNSASSRRTTATTKSGGVLGLLKAATENNEVPALNLDNNEQESQQQQQGESAEDGNLAIQSTHEQSPANNDKIYTYSGTLMGLGSRDQDKEKLERNRKQWVEDLKDQMERKRMAKKDMKMANLNEEHEVNYFGHQQQQPNSGRKSLEEISIKTGRTEEAVQLTRIQQSDSHLHQMNDNLPSAMRSSFFIGESAPRTNAFNEKKKQDQQRWREELKQQMNEQMEKKASNKQKQHQQGIKHEDEDLWFRHFDTMQQHATASRIESPRQQQPSSPTTTQQQQQQAMTNDNQVTQANGSNSMDGGATHRSDDGVISPTSHLRKMTSLLDPAEKDAILIRRQKQEEHRRAIAEQVEERKRLKEEQERARREEEEEEERKLNEDRINLQLQFEREKITQQQKEELRDKKTMELYQSMQEAKASALREKFEKRQKSLRRKGHDTTRLERTHRTTLDTKTSDTNHLVPPLNLKQVPSGITPVTSQHKQDDEVVIRSSRVQQQISDRHHNNNNNMTSSHHNNVMSSDRQHHHVTSSDRQHVTSATIHPTGGSGPIRLEISLNNTTTNTNSSLNRTKEISVQTDFNNPTSRHDTSIISETGTEYIPLPISRQGRQPPHLRNKSPRRKVISTASNKEVDQSRFDQNNLYDKYARQQQEGVGGKKNKEKPKWGVGRKKKEYKSTSQKYVSGQQWKEKHEENMKKREEQLLQQQALNERHLLISTTRNNNQKTSSVSPTEKKNSTTQQRINKKNDTRRHRIDDVTTDKPSSSHTDDVIFTSQHKFDHLPYDQRPMSVTTQEAKYDERKHSRSSPVPDTTNDFVEYRRSDVILNPNQLQSRPPTTLHHHGDTERPITSARKPSDPLIHGSAVKQNAKERQDRILKEISILRHGLLLKQREVASYPSVIPSTGAIVNKTPTTTTTGDTTNNTDN